MAHKTVIRATENGYFVDRGTPQPLKFEKIDGEVKALPVEYIYDCSNGTGYYSRERAIEVANDWPEPVEVVFAETFAVFPVPENFNSLSRSIDELENWLHRAASPGTDELTEIHLCDARNKLNELRLFFNTVQFEPRHV